MKKYLGLLWILLSFILTYIFWIIESSSSSMSIYRQYSQFISSTALVSFAWINYISSRHRFVDDFFNGLDKSYIYHKYLSILAVILIWIHNFTLKMGRFRGGSESTKITRLSGEFKPSENYDGSGVLGIHISGRQLGTWSLYAFTALTIFFLITYMIEYEKWKFLHKVMIIPYAFGVIHYYLDSDYSVFSLTAYSIWMNIINAIGILSAIYSVFFYEITAFKYKYKVSSIREAAKNTFEITGTSTGRELKYALGQFAFLKVIGRKKGFTSHPFTMCQCYKPGEIQFAIKVLGDHTAKLKNNLSVGDTIAVSGPYGKFNYKSGLKHQVWLAGGIGVTPFRSFWQTEIPKDYNVDFFYAYNNEQEGAYIDELKAIQNRSNVKIHLFDSSKSGFLQLSDFQKYINENEELDVFFCGPKVMRKKVKKDLKTGKYKVRNFYFEHFQFK